MATLKKTQSNEKPEQVLAETSTNLCIICSKRQREVAFIPCSHFIACVVCGHGLKICPKCGSTINALLRIFN